MCKSCSATASKILTNDLSDEIVSEDATALFSMDIISSHYGDEYGELRSAYARFIHRLFMGRRTPSEETLKATQEDFKQRWEELNARAQQTLRSGDFVPGKSQEEAEEEATEIGSGFYISPDKITFNHYKLGEISINTHHDISDEGPMEEVDESPVTHQYPQGAMCDHCQHTYGAHSLGVKGPCIEDDCGCAHFTKTNIEGFSDAEPNKAHGFFKAASVAWSPVDPAKSGEVSEQDESPKSDEF